MPHVRREGFGVFLNGSDLLPFFLARRRRGKFWLACRRPEQIVIFSARHGCERKISVCFLAGNEFQARRDFVFRFSFWQARVEEFNAESRRICDFPGCQVS